MAYYGEPDIGIEYTFVAVRPFKAEHPIGSGKTVYYEPGDQFPGEEWGGAAHNLVEVGKAVRLAVNVYPVVTNGKEPSSTTLVAMDEDDAIVEVEVTSYPIQLTRGWFELSDGRKVRGESTAVEAQSKLDAGE